MVKLLLVATPPPERQIIRDTIAEQLTADGYSITPVGLYIILLKPCNDSIADKTSFEMVNLPSFSINFDDGEIVVLTVRATSVRKIIAVDYADPMFVEKLAGALADLGICLPI